MASEVVRRQLLISVGALNLPLDRAPSDTQVERACDAARLLRNRLLREHSRITARIESLRQSEMYDQADSEEEDAEESGNYDYQGVARSEFIFVSEMLTAEKLVVPVLLAHGLQFPASLLPQFLKLLAALLAAVPRFSENETQQKDLLRHMKDRCGTDEFFAMLVQCVAPIAAKRENGNLQRDDVVLLEVVLTVLMRFIDGVPREAESTVGAFCRNHGLELLLVVVNQNFSKFRKFEAALSSNPAQTDAEEEGTIPQNSAEQEIKVETAPELGESSTHENNDPDSVPTIDITDDDLNDVDPLTGQDLMFDTQFKARMQKLLESDAQLWKWNTICMEAVAHVLACAPPAELAQIGVITQPGAASAQDVLDRLRNSKGFLDCKKERDNWRCIARSRNGAMNSNGILVRADPNRLDASAVGGRAIGTVSALLGTKRKDPLETLKDLDLRKKGRFIKGMFQDSTSRCNLPLTTKIQLSQQSESFLCLGFEPLSTMTWPTLQKDIAEIERATLEYREAVAGYKSSGEQMEITTPMDTTLYEKVQHVLDYMSMCTSFLHYIREVVHLMVDDNISFASATFQKQWQSVSSVISLDHFESGFIMLRCFLYARDLRRRLDVTVVVNFLAELLLALNLLLEGVLGHDSSVEVAAHALASSVLYKEDNIKALFDVLGEYGGRNIPIDKAQAFTLFTAAVFQLMEKCSYKGSLLLPKKEKKKSNAKVVTEAAIDDNDDQRSVTSSQQNSEQDELNSLADMINDEEERDEEDNEADDSGDVAHQLLKAVRDDAVEDELMLTTVVATTTRLEADAGSLQKSQNDVTQQPTDPALAPAPVDMQTEATPAEPETAFEPDSDDDATAAERAVSQARAPSEASLASSRRTALSTISSEREVAVSSYIRRLATPKNMGLLYSTLRNWRINDADVNLGLTYLMECLIKDGCENVFFNVAFLLLMREVLAYGQKTHAPLYRVCDQLVFSFFNPPYAKTQDSLAASRLNEQDLTVLRGAQSFLGFEVALRCARSLFNFSATDYSLLEEKGMPHLMDHVVIPLPNETSGPSAALADVLVDAAVQNGPTEEEEMQMVELIAKEIERSERSERKKRRREEKEASKSVKKHKKERKEKKHKKKKDKHRAREGRIHEEEENEEIAVLEEDVDLTYYEDIPTERGDDQTVLAE